MMVNYWMYVGSGRFFVTGRRIYSTFKATQKFKCLFKPSSIIYKLVRWEPRVREAQGSIILLITLLNSSISWKTHASYNPTDCTEGCHLRISVDLGEG